jgi:outer membrane protein TolC
LAQAPTKSTEAPPTAIGPSASPNPTSPPRHALPLSEVLARAERFSPNVRAAAENEQAAEQTLRFSKSFYYPTLDVTAIDSTGFPASANAPIGFNGVMSSPYREGLTGGAYTTFTFFDLTREYGVKAAHYGVAAAQEDEKRRRLDLDLKIMNFYLDASLNLSQRETWKNIHAEVDRLYGVVRKFVRNGQYSDVTQWLLQGQIEKAERREDEYELAYQAALRKVEINIGAPAGSFDVQGLEQINSTLAELAQHRDAESPYVAEPKLEIQVSQAQADRESAQNWPRLLGIASAGGMDSARLVPEQNYAAWIGLTFPVFEGFRISAAAGRAQAEAQRDADLSVQAQLELNEADIRFTQETEARQHDVVHYRAEKDDALKALKLAEHRYTTFVGDLADVRDALYSYEDALSGLNAAETEIYRSRLSQALFDGGYLPQ